MIVVTTPADTYDLVRLDDVRTALGIAESGEDENLARWISQASGAVAKHLIHLLTMWRKRPTRGQSIRLLIATPLEHKQNREIRIMDLCDGQERQKIRQSGVCEDDRPRSP